MTGKVDFLATRPIHGVAIDQGSGLSARIRQARGAQADPEDTFLFKKIVTETLSERASTVLVDAQYGRRLLPFIRPPCHPMLGYEADVYRISDADRITQLPDNLRVADYPDLGVPALKFFLYYGPDDPVDLNERKHALVRRIGAECRDLGVAFLFEPIVYRREVPDQTSAAFARLKPDLVARATRQFAAPAFNIDILKVEFPVSMTHVAGFGMATMSRAEAEAAFSRAAEAAQDVPIVYLSAGIAFELFEAGLGIARAAGVAPAGFMCGRAIWNDAVGVFGGAGPAATERWMADEGLRRLDRLIAALA